MAVWSIVKISELEGYHRLDAEYYQPKYLATAKALAGYPKLKQFLRRSIIHPTEIKRVYEDKGYPFALSQNIGDNLLDFSQQVFIPVETAELVSKNRVDTGDILMIRTGQVGKAAPYLGDPPNLYASAHVLIVKTKDIPPGYLSTYLNSKFGRTLLERGTYGALQPELAPSYVETVPIPRLGDSMERAIESIVLEAYEVRKRSDSLYLQAEQLLLDELGFKDLGWGHQVYWTVPFKRTKEAGRLDAEHFQPKYDRVVEFIKKREYTTLAGLGKVLRGKNPSKYTEEGIPVIRAIDLRNILDASTFLRCPAEKGLFYLHTGDILISSIGWGSIGKVATFTHSEQMVTVSEVSVIRQTEIEPLALQIFLQSPLGQLQLERKITGSTGQLHLYPRDIGTVVIPHLVPSLQQQIADLVTQSWEARQKARQLLEEAKSKVENLIEGES